MAIREVSRRTIEGRWICPHCGATNLGRHMSCRSCSADRGGAEVRLPADPGSAPSMTHEGFLRLVAGSNPPRGRREVEPPDARRDADAVRWEWEPGWQAAALAREPLEPPQPIPYGVYRGPSPAMGDDADAGDIRAGWAGSRVRAARDAIAAHAERLAELVTGHGRLIAGAVAVASCAAAIAWGVAPHPIEIVPEAFKWQRVIEIAELRTVEESGWSVPEGGREYDRQWEYHYDQKVHDGYHYEDYVTYERQCTGTRTWTEYEYNGDGSYDAVTYEEDVYETVPVFHTERVEDWHYEEVWDYRYYYEIERWVHSRSVVTGGEGHDPHWGDVELSGPTGDHGTGQEAETGRRGSYWVICEDGECYEVANERFWRSLEVGGTFEVLLHSDGHIAPKA